MKYRRDRRRKSKDWTPSERRHWNVAAGIGNALNNFPSGNMENSQTHTCDSNADNIVLSYHTNTQMSFEVGGGGGEKCDKVFDKAANAAIIQWFDWIIFLAGFLIFLWDCDTRAWYGKFPRMHQTCWNDMNLTMGWEKRRPKLNRMSRWTVTLVTAFRHYGDHFLFMAKYATKTTKILFTYVL